jgi:uncharacterized protein (AIM24 family)
MSMGIKKTEDPLVHRPTHLAPGKCAFEALDGDAGVTVTLDGPTSINYAPGLFFMGSPHTEAIYWQCSHPQPPQRWRDKRKSRLLRLWCGGGDFFVHTFQSHGNQGRPESVTLRAGLNKRVCAIDLRALEGKPRLWFLHKSYVCSSSNIVIRSVACKGSQAAVARSFYVLEADLPDRAKGAAVLYLAGMAKVVRVKLRPGEGLRVNQGHVLGATDNIDYISEPIAISHISESSFSRAFQIRRRKRRQQASKQAAAGSNGPPGRPLRERWQRAWEGSKILWNSIRTGEGLYAYSLRNNSENDGHVFLQVERPLIPESPGLIGWAIYSISSLARIPGVLKGLGMH